MSSSTQDMDFEEYIDSLKIPLEEIELATNNFSDENLLTRGTSFDVYKGQLLQQGDSINIVARKCRQRGIVGNEFVVLKDLKHKNIVSIYKWTGKDFDKDDEVFIIINKYEANESLHKHLGSPALTWMRRLLICVGVAHALSYLHYDAKENHYVIHGNIKSSKILLDHNWEPKLHSFKFAAVARKHHINLTNKYNGSLHYMDPAYEDTRGLNHKSDIFSFGVVLFEVLFGREESIPNHDNWYFARMARAHYEERKLDNLIDPVLRKQMNLQSLNMFAEVAYCCIKEKRSQRPDMNMIRTRLERALELQRKHEQSTVAAAEGTTTNHFKGKSLDHLRLRLTDIELATYNFSETCYIGSGGYGMVYKAELDHFDGINSPKIEEKNKGEFRKKHRCVAIKRLHNRLDTQGEQGFVSEIETLSNCKHLNIVSLLGFCDEGRELILVYEYVAKGSLDDYLGNMDGMNNLVWAQRLQICLDIAHGLNYLHTRKPMIIHRDIKSANILLDDNWVAKIADFGLAKLQRANQQGTTLITNNIAGTEVYLDPEYMNTGKLKKESDIYSFGVVLFEVLCGRLAYDEIYSGRGLPSVARQRFNEGTLKGMVDPKLMEADEIISLLKGGVNQDSLETFSKIAHQCLAETQSRRPTMEVIIKELEKALNFQNAYEVWGPRRRNYREIIKILEKWKIPLEVIHLATDNFDKKYHIGSGGYARVYKAELNYLDIPTLATKIKSTDELSKMQYTVAIKRIFSKKDNQENPKLGFLAEFDVACRCEHPNIISFLGCCVEGSELLLVYEYASNGSLDDYLVSTDKMVNLTWAQRLQMCIGIAHGLNYLHTNMKGKRRIIHRDIKSANILLGENCEAKIADFGLSKIHHGNQEISTINTTTIAGTHFYCDPEYARTGKLKNASDIYSFGVVLLEIFSGKLAYDETYMVENAQGLVPIAQRHFENGTLQDILDYKMLDEVSELGLTLRVRPDHDSLELFSKIACQCLERNQDKRPTTEVIIHHLKEALQLQENRRKTLRISLEQIKSGVENFSDGKCIMRGGYGILYKGTVQDHNRHKKVVVKRFTGQEHGFLKEFEVLFKYKQENIISLVGYCKEMEEKIIVYEDASNGCLSRYLNDSSFSWTKRLKICVDIANGLKFLHGGDLRQDVVIHRDLKSSNVLLTDDWKAKVCGFEFALINPTYKETEYDINDAVVSAGYCDPLYWETKVLTKESDIYSFGVILFEILCGRLACPEDDRDHGPLLLDDLVKSHREAALLVKIVFDGIKKHIAQKSFAIFQEIAFQCLEEKREERPRAGDVVIQLQKALEFQEVYEKRKAKLDRTYEEILHEFPENYPTMRKRRIYNILSKEILEDDKLLIGEHAEDYHSDS